MTNGTQKRLFRLGGKEYAISKFYVEEAMKGSSPKQLGKYGVLVAGKEYPPKQVISESLGIDLVSFTTMDASRILTALGFEVVRVGKRSQPQKNESELLFEQYLAMSGLFDVEFEKQFPGATQRPDYVVRLQDGSEIIFEVKEFRATATDFRGSGGGYDPYGNIREKIQQARERFKSFKDKPCCLVLFNREKPLVDLSWKFIYGAMLGNLGFRIPFNPDSGTFDSSAMVSVFTSGGSMHRHQGEQPIAAQNQTISGILVLDLLPVGRLRFDAFVEEIEHKREMQAQPKLTLEEHLQLLQESQGTERDYSLVQLRGVMHENPYARMRLPASIFMGPYDEWYGSKDDRVQRLYAGNGIRAIEAMKGGKPRRRFI